jgi:hypothetical protein
VRVSAKITEFKRVMLISACTFLTLGSALDASAQSDKEAKAQLKGTLNHMSKASYQGCLAAAASQNRDMILTSAKAANRTAELLVGKCSLSNPLPCAMAQFALNQANFKMKEASVSQNIVDQSSTNGNASTMQKEKSKALATAKALVGQGVTASGDSSVTIGAFTIPIPPVSNATAPSVFSDAKLALQSGVSQTLFDLAQSSLSEVQSQVKKEVTFVATAIDCKGSVDTNGTQQASAIKDAPKAASIVSTGSSTVGNAPVRAPVDLAGLFVLKGDTRFGIVQDNLFNMVSRRYQSIEATLAK